MRKVLTSILLIGFTAMLWANGSGETDQVKKTIYFYQQKIEIDQALKDITARYAQEHPDVEFIIESVSENYPTGLKTKFAGGQAPDIFHINGGKEFELWESRLENLGDQSWTNDIIDIYKGPVMSEDGGIYGFPISVEGTGFVYSKDMFEKAGIEGYPETLSEMKEAAAKLSAAGIQPMTSTFGDWYQSGMFLVNIGLARQDDPIAFIKGLNNGTETIVGNKAFLDLCDLIHFYYAQSKSPLNTDFNQQVSQYLGEKIGMTIGGNWLDPSIKSNAPDMRPGLFGMPIGDDPEKEDRVYAGLAGYWVVNNASPVKKEVKDFLNWLATSEEGRKAITDELLFIPAFTSFSANEDLLGPLSLDLARYVKQEKVYGLYYNMYPSGAAEEFGTAVQMVAAGKITDEEFLQMLQDIWDNLKN